MRVDGDTVGHRTAQSLRHGIGVFGRVELQLGVLDILFQQALALETATHSLTDQLNQLFQHTLVGRLNALKVGRTIVATHADAVQEQAMEVDIHVQRTTKTLNQCYGPGRASLKRISSFVDQMGPGCAVNDMQNLALSVVRPFGTNQPVF